MSAITDLAHDERSARMLLAILAKPDDPVTGRVLSRAGAVIAACARSVDGVPRSFC